MTSCSNYLITNDQEKYVRFPTGPGTYDALQKSLVAAPNNMLQLTDNQNISVRFFIMVNITKMSNYYESHSVCSVLQDDRNSKDNCNANNNN